MKVKVGDVVKVKEGFACQFEGQKVKITSLNDDGDYADFELVDGNGECSEGTEYFEPIEFKAPFQHNDLIGQSELSQYRVLGVAGEVVFLSGDIDISPNTIQRSLTCSELEDLGYKVLKGAEDVEVSMDEIAEKFGVDVNRLKVKK